MSREWNNIHLNYIFSKISNRIKQATFTCMKAALSPSDLVQLVAVLVLTLCNLC